MAEYAHPESLVSTDWVAQHLNDPNLRLVEVDVDTSAYEQGHIAGAVGWNWQSQLQQSVHAMSSVKKNWSNCWVVLASITTLPSSSMVTTITGLRLGLSGS